MRPKKLLSLGWIVAILFILGTSFMGNLLVDYSHVSQTVSEIGEVGSPLYVPFQILTITVGILLILFGIGVRSFAKHKKLSVVPALFVMIYGLAELGIGIFASPHPLHNMFGLLMTLGYFSPLLFFLFWNNKLGKSFKWFSLITFVLVILGIFLNLSPMFNPTLYPMEYYGIVQRFLLFTFYIYCALISYHAIFSYTLYTKTAVPDNG